MTPQRGMRLDLEVEVDAVCEAGFEGSPKLVAPLLDVDAHGLLEDEALVDDLRVDVEHRVQLVGQRDAASGRVDGPAANLGQSSGEPQQGSAILEQLGCLVLVGGVSNAPRESADGGVVEQVDEDRL